MDKKVPVVRFKGFTDDWEQHQFSDLYTVNKERNTIGLSKEKTLSISSMTFNTSGNGAKSQSLPAYKVLRIGDIAFEGHHNKNFMFGRFVLNDAGLGIMSPRFTALRPVSNDTIPYWKEYIHYEPIMRHVLVKSTKSGTMMNELVSKDFFKQSILVPSKLERDKIGYLLKLIEKTLTLYQQKNDLLLKSKQAFSKNLFANKHEVTPNVRFRPYQGDWEKIKLSKVANIIGGGTPSTKITKYWDGNIDWYTPAEIGKSIYTTESKRKITELGLHKSSAKMLPEGTVIFSSRAGIGNTAILSKPASTNQGFQSIVPIKDKLDSYFIYSKSKDLKRYGEKVGAGSTFVEVSGKQMREMTLMLPTFSEQITIGKIIKLTDNDITLNRQKIERIKQLKKMFLLKLFV